jgi:hypothetical protein
MKVKKNFMQGYVNYLGPPGIPIGTGHTARAFTPLA